MKEYYQSKGGKKGRFALRENTYRRTWYLIADYPFFKKVQQDRMMALKGGCCDGAEETGQHTGRISATTVRETAYGYRIDGQPLQCLRYIEAIEDALTKVPDIYADDVMRHITERIKYKDMEGVSEKALKMWVQRFIWQVAHNLGDV